MEGKDHGGLSSRFLTLSRKRAEMIVFIKNEKVSEGSIQTRDPRMTYQYKKLGNAHLMDTKVSITKENWALYEIDEEGILVTQFEMCRHKENKFLRYRMTKAKTMTKSTKIRYFAKRTSVFRCIKEEEIRSIWKMQRKIKILNKIKYRNRHHYTEEIHVRQR